MADLVDQVVLVTGGSRGIGAAIALTAASSGADVAISFLDRPEEADRVISEIRKMGRRAMAVGVDLAQPAGGRRLVGEVEAEMGRIDALVNNAGVMPETPFLDISDREWGEVLAVDLTAPFVCSQTVLPGMISRKRGSIVMISSRLGQIGWAGVAHYAAAKAGLLGLTKSLAREFGPLGIRVNAVAPGPTITEMSAAMLEGEGGRRREADLPAGRLGRPQDVADTVVFLLSDAAAMYHGQTLCPNGGGYMP
ncbi:MAG TPA: 3-oxoacyl-ACP reductase family protein [Acidimicrobiia bacterium]|nr:3-oxoacyl-ACP reductase family protein [Acidimicrobiia bacterium]